MKYVEIGRYWGWKRAVAIKSNVKKNLRIICLREWEQQKQRDKTAATKTTEIVNKDETNNNYNADEKSVSIHRICFAGTQLTKWTRPSIFSIIIIHRE